MCRQQAGICWGKKWKNLTAVAVGFLLDFAEWCKRNTTNLFFLLWDRRMHGEENMWG